LPIAGPPCRARADIWDGGAFPAFAVPPATPKDIAKKLSGTLIGAGTDEKVKQLLSNYLIVGPLSFERDMR